MLQRARTQTRTDSRYTDSVLLSKIAWQNVQLCSVLGNGPSRYRYAAVGKNLHNFFVAERISSFFIADEVGDRVFDARIAERSAAGGQEWLRKGWLRKGWF